MIVASEADMLQLGRELAAGFVPGDIVAIDGTLGAGKTVLCRGILRGLGYAGEVSSPSYALINSYAPPETSLPVIHADLYRLKAASEIEEIGLFEGSADNVILIEWASVSEICMQRATAIINIKILDHMQRQVVIANQR